MRIKNIMVSTSQVVQEILKGNRTILSRAITLTESTLSQHLKQSREIVEQCLPHSGNSIRIGITGVPGVGKSTFIESMGRIITSNGLKLAVLAIDPSSEKTKGSILGDKTRMEELSKNPLAFIRPSPSSCNLGGVARHTRESIILCEAAGFDVIFVETVGVGQSETAVHSMVDMFLLLMLAGAGDELQGIKRGIMEMVDLIAINKADGNNFKEAELAAAEYKHALQLFPASQSGWIPDVLTCSSITQAGLITVWNSVSDYFRLTKSNGFFEIRRKSQSLYWMYESIHDRLKDDFYSHPYIEKNLLLTEQKVIQGEMSSLAAADWLLKQIK
jgi:LAO/AO transport system kinase